MTLEKFIESLANVLDLTEHTVEAGTVLFHGTPIPMRGVYLDPNRLEGDKWFTTYQNYAKGYAEKSGADPGGVPSAAVFRVTIKEKMLLAKQIDRRAESGMGLWASAVQEGFFSGHGSSGFAIERKYIRKAIEVRFGQNSGVVGLHKQGENDEFLVLDCEQRISNVEHC